MEFQWQTEVEEVIRRTDEAIRDLKTERDKYKAKVEQYHRAILEITGCEYCEGIGELCAGHVPSEPEPDSYCEYCSEGNPTYERDQDGTNVATGVTTTTTYFFCNDECADQWEASQ